MHGLSCCKSGTQSGDCDFGSRPPKEGTSVTVVNMEPGFLPTRLTEYDFVDDMETSIAGLVKGVETLTKENNDQFIEWSGRGLRYYEVFGQSRGVSRIKLT